MGQTLAGSSAAMMDRTSVIQTARVKAVLKGLKLLGLMGLRSVVPRVVRRASKCFYKLAASLVGSWVRLKGLQRVGGTVDMTG